MDAFDDLNDAVTEAFGTDETVTVLPRGRASFGIARAIFDDNHRLIRFEDDVQVSTTAPALFVERGALPEGFRFDDGDRIKVGAASFVVVDEQPDSVGGLVLVLQKIRGGR